MTRMKTNIVRLFDEPHDIFYALSNHYLLSVVDVYTLTQVVHINLSSVDGIVIVAFRCSRNATNA